MSIKDNVSVVKNYNIDTHYLALDQGDKLVSVSKNNLIDRLWIFLGSLGLGKFAGCEFRLKKVINYLNQNAYTEYKNNFSETEIRKNLLLLANKAHFLSKNSELFESMSCRETYAATIVTEPFKGAPKTEEIEIHIHGNPCLTSEEVVKIVQKQNPSYTVSYDVTSDRPLQLSKNTLKDFKVRKVQAKADWMRGCRLRLEAYRGSLVGQINLNAICDASWGWNESVYARGIEDEEEKEAFIKELQEMKNIWAKQLIACCRQGAVPINGSELDIIFHNFKMLSQNY